MREEFYEIYDSLVRDFLDDLYIHEFGYWHRYIERARYERILEYRRIIIQSIEEIFRPLHKSRLRPDALFFLIINFDQMVVLPLLLSNENFEEINLRSMLKKDIETILNTAEEYSNDDEISSHAIITAVDKKWKNLDFSRLEIWG